MFLAFTLALVAHPVGTPSAPAFNHDTSLHVEGFYKYQVNDHISLTPGIIWITAPKQNNDNPDIVVGELRTSFTF